MTSKEKAEELAKKFIPNVQGWDCYHDSPRDELDVMKDAKACALIAVDEIIYQVFVDAASGSERMKFWQYVRQELENL